MEADGGDGGDGGDEAAGVGYGYAFWADFINGGHGSFISGIQAPYQSADSSDSSSTEDPGEDTTRDEPRTTTDTTRTTDTTEPQILQNHRHHRTGHHRHYGYHSYRTPQEPLQPQLQLQLLQQQTDHRFQPFLPLFYLLFQCLHQAFRSHLRKPHLHRRLQLKPHLTLHLPNKGDNIVNTKIYPRWADGSELISGRYRQSSTTWVIDLLILNRVSFIPICPEFAGIHDDNAYASNMPTSGRDYNTVLTCRFFKDHSQVLAVDGKSYGTPSAEFTKSSGLATRNGSVASLAHQQLQCLYRSR